MTVLLQKYQTALELHRNYVGHALEKMLLIDDQIALLHRRKELYQKLYDDSTQKAKQYEQELQQVKRNKEEGKKEEKVGYKNNL